MSKAIIAKRKAGWRCERCDSTESLAAHHQIPGDDSSLIVLCGECHSKEHPNVPKSLFFRGRRELPISELPNIIPVFGRANKLGAPKKYISLHIPKAICKHSNIRPGTRFAVSNESYRVGKLILEQVKEDKENAA